MSRLVHRRVAGLVVCAALAACSADPPDTLVESAKAYLARGDTPAAVIQLKNALQKRPDLAEARFLLGRALLDGGDAAGALIELEKARALGHRAEDWAPAMAEALLASGQQRKLIDEFASTTLALPQAQAELLTSLAAAHLALGRQEPAEAAWRAALQAVPDYVPARLVQARQLAGQRRLDAALALLDETLARAPDHHDAWLTKADMLFYGVGDSAGALEAYRRAAAMRPAGVAALGGIVAVHLARRDVPAARQQFDALRKVQPTHPQTRFFDAQIAFYERDLKRTQEILAQLLKAAPDNAPMLQLAGVAALESGSLLQAEQHLAKAAQVLPPGSIARRALVQTYLRLGEPAKAVAAAAPLLEHEAPSAETLSLVASAHLQHGDAPKAEALLARAVRLDPQDTKARTALAVARLSGPTADAALRELEALAAADGDGGVDMALIHARVERREFDAALKAIDRLAAKQPTKPLAEHWRGRVALERGDAAGARRAFEKALALDGAHFPALEGLARLDIKDGEAQRAEARFDALLQREPSHVQALLALAQLRARAGAEPARVLELLQRAVAAAPSDPAPRVARIEYELLRNDPKAALEAAQAALGLLPNHPRVLDAAARAQLASGDVNQAIASFGKLAAAQPRSTAAHLGLAGARLQAGAADAAARDLARALEIDPDLAAAQQQLVALHLAAGRRAEALALARSVQARRPGAAAGYVYEGDAEAAGKRWTQAAAAYRQALQRSAPDGTAEKLHGALLGAGRAAEADAFAVDWLKQHPGDAGFVFHVGGVALAKEDWAAAEARFQRVLELQPEHAAAHNNIAWVLLRLGKTGGLGHAEKANALRPDTPAFLDTWAALLAADGQFGRALELQQRAVALRPGSATLRLSLARLHLQAGDKARARRELEALLQAGDKSAADAEARRLLAEL